ncbi:MAG: tetratricopeptide repeat protein, partial [Roseiarcus sp.]
MSWRFGWLALAAFMAFASPVVAADRDWDACSQSSSGGQDWDRQITGCSNVLSRGSRETIAKRAVALNNRGLGYDNKADHDRAIVDYSDAIRLLPNFPVALA